MGKLKKSLLPDVLTNFILGLGFFRALQKLQKKNVHFFGHTFFITIYDNNPIARPNLFFLHYKNVLQGSVFREKTCNFAASVVTLHLKNAPLE